MFEFDDFRLVFRENLRAAKTVTIKSIHDIKGTIRNIKAFLF